MLGESTWKQALSCTKESRALLHMGLHMPCRSVAGAKMPAAQWQVIRDIRSAKTSTPGLCSITTLEGILHSHLSDSDVTLHFKGGLYSCDWLVLQRTGRRFLSKMCLSVSRHACARWALQDPGCCRKWVCALRGCWPPGLAAPVFHHHGSAQELSWPPSHLR